MWRKAIILWGLFLFCQPAIASESDLVISEIMYDALGSDSGREWIEIYNSGSEDVIASSTWRFFDGSNHNISLYQGTSTIASGNYFVLADNGEQFLLDYPDYQGILFDTVMSLPNSSSSIALSFDKGATYGPEDYYDFSWGANGDGYSLEKINLLSTSTDNWQVSADVGGTPGQINSEAYSDDAPSEDTPPEDDDVWAWGQLIINEFMPNPVGSDDNEWIELYNRGPEVLNLLGLKIKDTSARIFTLDVDSNINLNLLANNYLLIPKSISGISLNNSSGDAVIIIDNNNNIIENISYDKAIEGKSYARDDNNNFVWTKTPSPGQTNMISINQAPVAQISVEESSFVVGEKISFSASNSYDPEAEDLDYLWQFGDEHNSSKENIKHSFDALGSYTVRLTVTDSEGASDMTEFLLNIKQKEESAEVEDIETQNTEEDKIIVDLAEDDLIISEFIPNPVGSDDNEWIELYNNSDKDIDLYAWQLDDQEGGSKPYKFSTSTVIASKDFLLLDRSETKITLNNSNDAVRLLTPTGDIWQAVAYEKIPEGKSYAWDFINNEWAISEASPGEVNVFEEVAEEQIIYAIEELNDLTKNQEVIVQGVAINNIEADERSLYLADYNFSKINFEEIVEIYSYYKTWPDIKAGDLVTVQEQLAKAEALPRVKIKTADDIWKNDVHISLSEPEMMELEDIDEDKIGSYINTKGIVVKKSGQNIYLSSDAEEDYLLRVYTKFSAKDLEIKKGDEMIVSGMLSQTDAAFKLVPFAIGDILVSKQVLGTKIEVSENAEIAISTSTSQVLSEDRKNSIKNVLIFIIIASFLISTIYIFKRKKTSTVDSF